MTADCAYFNMDKKLPVPLREGLRGWFCAMHSGVSSVASIYRFTPANGSLDNAGYLLIPFNMPGIFNFPGSLKVLYHKQRAASIMKCHPVYRLLARLRKPRLRKSGPWRACYWMALRKSRIPAHYRSGGRPDLQFRFHEDALPGSGRINIDLPQ